jgi:hypothetical protein
MFGYITEANQVRTLATGTHMLEGQKDFKLFHDLHNITFLLRLDALARNLPERFGVDSKMYCGEAATSETV